MPGKGSYHTAMKLARKGSLEVGVMEDVNNGDDEWIQGGAVERRE